MAEAKRIVPMPLKGMKPLAKEKKEKSAPPTLRFTLSLTASTDKTCPEISYVDLVRNAVCKDKDGVPTPNKDAQVVDPDDPFAADDAKEVAEVERIARHFEEKYGPPASNKGKKRRKDRIEDLVDMGMGYDETDPFVDNSECYDELVPADITTKLGGFYINSGVLEFRDVSDSDSEGNIKAPGVKRKTPKIVSDSEDSQGDFVVFKDKQRKRMVKFRKPSKDGVEKDGVRKRKRLKDPLDPNKPKKPRKPREKGDGTTKPRKKSTPTVAELLMRQQQLQQPGQPLLSTSGTPNNTSPPSAGLPNQNNNVSPSNLLGSAGFGTLGTDVASNPSLLTSSILSGIGDGSQGAGDGINPEKPPNLPTGLPSDLQTTIVKLKENMLSVGQLRSFPSLSASIQQAKAAEMSSDGKCKFFTPSVNSMLLDVEMQSRELKCSERSGVFAHLAAHLPCTKDTLLKRAKKLRHSELDGQLREPLFRLREAIGKVMPEQIRRHQEECKIATQAKLEQLQESQHSQQKDGDQENPGSTSDEDEEGNKNSLDNIKIKRSSMPRRKFEWTDEIRKKLEGQKKGIVRLPALLPPKLFYDVVRVKVQHYDKSRSQSAEEFLKTYFEQEVKNLWPKGWMQARMLFKESRCIHSCITSQPPKQKKIQVNPAPKKTAIVKFGLDHPPHVWGWIQQERRAPSPVLLPSGDVVSRSALTSGGSVSSNNVTPVQKSSPGQTFTKPSVLSTSSSALQSMSLFASCVAAEKQATSAVSSPPSSLPNAPSLTSSISSFIPTLLDYADLDGKTKPKESPPDNSIGHAIDAVVRQARSHSQPAQDLTVTPKTSLQQSSGAAKKPVGDVRPTMKSPPSTSQIQQQRPLSEPASRMQYGKSFQALFEQSIQQSGYSYPLPRQNEVANSQPPRQQAAVLSPPKMTPTTSQYSQFQPQAQSSQPKAKPPQAFTKPQYQTSPQAPMFSNKGQPYPSQGQTPPFERTTQGQASPFERTMQVQTSPFKQKTQGQTLPYERTAQVQKTAPFERTAQGQTSPFERTTQGQSSPFDRTTQGQTSPFERTTQGSPKAVMGLAHGSQGRQSGLSHSSPNLSHSSPNLSHSSPNLSPHGQGYKQTSPLSHQKPTTYSSSSPKFTSSSLANIGGISVGADLASFQLPGLSSLPQTQRGRPSLPQQPQLGHPTTQALPVYQMGLGDPRREQTPPTGTQQGRGQSDAIITGPAPGTYNHVVQAYGPGGSLPPFGTLRSSPTRQPYPSNQFSQAFSVPESLGSGRLHEGSAKNQGHGSNNSTSPHRQIQ